jgi:hypothetical protein
MKKNNKRGGTSALKTIINDLNKPENLNMTKIIKPSEIPLDNIARLKCFQCG